MLAQNHETGDTQSNPRKFQDIHKIKFMEYSSVF